MFKKVCEAVNSFSEERLLKECHYRKRRYLGIMTYGKPNYNVTLDGFEGSLCGLTSVVAHEVNDMMSNFKIPSDDRISFIAFQLDREDKLMMVVHFCQSGEFGAYLFESDFPVDDQ